MDEFSLIGGYFRPLATAPEALNLTDDAALIPGPGGGEWAVTVDMLVAGVHFFPDDPPDLIARKVLRVNLSDLAAMGAHPRFCLLAGSLPHGTDPAWLEAFTYGLGEDARRFGLALIGGDTTATPGPLTLSLTALGEVPQGAALRRDGARAHDMLFVTGTLGDAALGLDMLRHRLPSETSLIARYRLPEPRVATGMALRGIATACMDVSDGLLADLGHLCAASGTGATVWLEHLPLSPVARACVEKEDALWTRIVGGGDDYELLFTAPKHRYDALAALAEQTGVPIACIGTIEPEPGVRVLDRGTPRPFTTQGYNHFEARP